MAHKMAQILHRTSRDLSMCFFCNPTIDRCVLRTHPRDRKTRFASTFAILIGIAIRASRHVGEASAENFSVRSVLICILSQKTGTKVLEI